MTERQCREAVFDPSFLEDLIYWLRTDRKRAPRILGHRLVYQVTDGLV